MNRRQVTFFREKEVGGITPRAFANAIRASEGLIGSLAFERKLEGHRGQVHTLCFNTDGTKLLSGSGELILWDWEAGSMEKNSKPPVAFISNAQFMPQSNNSIIVSGDWGKVMHVDLSERGTETMLMNESELGEVPKMFDLRAEKYRKTDPIIDSQGENVPLYDIAIDPINPDLIAVSGAMKAAHIYDVRKLVGSKSALSNSMVCSVFPTKSSRSSRAGWGAEEVVGLAYSNTGELLMSYLEEDMYLLPRSQVTSSNSEIGEQVVYRGHKNSGCRSGVYFLGPNSEYVSSGSDTGHTNIWRKKDGELLRSLIVDEFWVRCIASHPIDSSLATSGQSENINVWASKSFDSQRTTEEDINLRGRQEENAEEEKEKEISEAFNKMCDLNEKKAEVGLTAEEEQILEQLTQFRDEWEVDFEEIEAKDEVAKEMAEVIDKIEHLVIRKAEVGLTDEEEQNLKQLQQSLGDWAAKDVAGKDALDKELPGNN